MAAVDPDGRLPKDFPMGVHPNGQYYKKRLKKPYYFGAVKAGWKAALEQFNHDWSYILAGKNPPPRSDGSGVEPSTVEFIARSFIARELTRLERHQLAGNSFVDIRSAVEVATTILGRHKKAAHLCPSDFADLRHQLGNVWKKQGEGDAARWVKTDTLVGPAALKRRIVHVRAMFRWAGPDREKLMDSLPRYGDEFALVSDSTIKKSLAHSERKHGAKRFEPEDILPIFNGLDAQLQAMFLLSINCGFTAADCSALPWSAVNLKTGMIDFARVKTGVERMKLPLWPETVTALKHVAELKLSPGPGLSELVVHQDRGDRGEALGDPIKLKDCVFITSRGRPWVERKTFQDEAGIPQAESHKDSIALAFNKALVALELKRARVGFGAGRHTFETNALRVADKSLVDAVMGHSTGAMSQRYDHAMADDLRAMIQGVRARLLTDAKWGQISTDAAALRLVS